MIDGLTGRLDEVELLIIKIAQLIGVALICVAALKNHLEHLLRRPNRRRSATDKRKLQRLWSFIKFFRNRR
jgi:hypothetical protein